MALNLFDYKKYPRMAHWFNPLLLLKLLNKVIVSGTFGQYADRRLMIAALDTVLDSEHVNRATNITSVFKNEDVWFDYVADLGDGFDATYAIAYLLGKEQLKIGEETLPRGRLLLMGGDQVYPTADKDAYRDNMREPYALALPDHDRKDDDGGIPLYAVPGNHDWYDGLVLFVALFCRAVPWHIGKWRTRQRRSYFALRLTSKWWLWCPDIQLTVDMDMPQKDYFDAIARSMPDGSKIILCSAEPGWLNTKSNKKSFDVLGYVTGIAAKAKRNLSCPIFISGDTHHYSRYVSEDGKQLIVSGGGGAFLHPTHQLEEKVEMPKGGGLGVQWPLTLQPSCFPPKATSRWLLWRNIFFAFTNWDFSIMMGLIYWLGAVALYLRQYPDAWMIVGLIFCAAFIGYTWHQEKPATCGKRAKVLILSTLHGLAHTFALVKLTQFFFVYNAQNFPLSGQWYDVWHWLLILLIEVGVVGGLVGGTIFGLNLLVTCAFFGMNNNDAFSALRLGTWRNFLRIRIKGDEVTIYPIGLKRTPKRREWIDKSDETGHAGPLVVPSEELQPEFIEKPIVIK